MSYVRRVLSLGSVASLFVIGSLAEAGQAAGAAAPSEVRQPNRRGRSQPLRTLPATPPGLPRREPHPPLRLRPTPPGLQPGSDPVVQTSMGPTAPGDVLNFEGIGNLNGVLPPDTNGDIGPNHYVQWVNLSFAVYDRAGTLLMGPLNGNQIFSGFGGPCETTNDGDPIVLHDEAADRWLLSQFALPNFPRGPYIQCIAISATPDPTDAYHLYEYEFPKMNDYPKFGVWPDGYYLAINQFRSRGPFLSWAGQGIAAFDRNQMLTGAGAVMVYFDLESTDPNLGGMLPADLDGAAPPAGSPAHFAQVDDDAWGYSPDQIQLWQLQANWGDPSSSTFTKEADLPTAAFDSNMCGYDRDCIPQPGTTTKLDALSDRLMYRMQYRNRAGQEALVISHTVDVNGTDVAGVRWYELRRGGAGWTIGQQGTYAPADGNHRWMSSAAMDRDGNIAMGYNLSSGTTSPSIHFTTRCADDPPGQMGTEGIVLAGSGHQTHSSSRWGDYSMLAVDPDDGSTFWFTGEYYDTASVAGWKTFVGSFTVGGCGGNTAPTVTIDTPADGTTVDAGTSINFSGTAVDSEDGNISSNLDWTSDVDGAIGSGSAISATLSESPHVVTASVTDSGGLSGSDSIAVTVNPGPGGGGITLTATTRKDRGMNYVDLEWTGASGDQVNVLRDGALVATTDNDGAYTDSVGRGSGSHEYQVCTLDGGTCSAAVVVSY